jgi:hypothetical protein
VARRGHAGRAIVGVLPNGHGLSTSEIRLEVGVVGVVVDGVGVDFVV